MRRHGGFLLNHVKTQTSSLVRRQIREKGWPQDTVPNFVKREYSLKTAIAKERCCQASPKFLQNNPGKQVSESKDAWQARVGESKIFASELEPWYAESSKSSLLVSEESNEHKTSSECYGNSQGFACAIDVSRRSRPIVRAAGPNRRRNFTKQLTVRRHGISSSRRPAPYSYVYRDILHMEPRKR